MFRSSYNKGFTMTFQNGLTISVQWGAGNYCERRSFHRTHVDDMKNITNESPTAEIAIWSNDGTDFNFKNDWVKGYVSADEVAEWIAAVKTVRNINDLNALIKNKHTAFVMSFIPNEDEGPEYDSAGYTEADRIVDGSYRVKSNITSDDINTHHCDDPSCNCSI